MLRNTLTSTSLYLHDILRSTSQTAGDFWFWAFAPHHPATHNVLFLPFLHPLMAAPLLAILVHGDP